VRHALKILVVVFCTFFVGALLHQIGLFLGWHPQAAGMVASLLAGVGGVMGGISWLVEDF